MRFGTLASFFSLKIKAFNHFFKFIGFYVGFFALVVNGKEINRYGFNGKENDSKGEWGGQNHYDYGFRIYNPGIGKFLSVDPLAKSYPELTPYQFASNRPIDGVDLEGLEYYNKTSRVGFSVSGNFNTVNNFIRIDRQNYRSTQLLMSDFVIFSRGWVEDKVFESDLELYNDRFSGSTKPEWDNLVGKGRIVNPQLIPRTPGQRIGYGIGAIVVLLGEGLNVVTKSQINSDLGITRQHAEKLNETWNIVNNAKSLNLIPDELNSFGGMIDLSNYILDTQLPSSKDEKYNTKVAEVGKFLFENRDALLTPKKQKNEKPE